MEHTQKMFLVPQHQIDLLKQQVEQHHTPDQNNSNLRQVVQNELDKEMADVLKLPDTNVYEKAKKYSAILQRYLTLVRQGEREKSVLTLSLPTSEHSVADDDSYQAVIDGGDTTVTDITNDPLVVEVLKHMPKRSRQKAEHVLEALCRSKGLISWTRQGELVVNQKTIRGSHLFDLVKSVTASHNVLDGSRPHGWNVFLKSLASLNMPLSAIPNTQVRQAIAEYKGVGESSRDGTPQTTKKRRTLYLTETPRSRSLTPLRTSLGASSWIDF